MSEDSADIILIVNTMESPVAELVSTISGENNSEKTAECDCIVCDLLSSGFDSKSSEEKEEIISEGRPTPDLKLTKQTKLYVRHFQTDNFKKCDWLTGCETKSLLYCWPCVLFSTEKNPWSKTGFSNLSNIHKLMKRHSSSEAHLHSIMKEKTFGKLRTENGFGDQPNSINEQHNQQVRKNREILKRLIDIVCFLGEHEMGFRGHSESENSPFKGNYVDLVNLLAKYDETLKLHLDNSTVFKGTSNIIQNDLIGCIGEITLRKIKNEIAEASYIAIILEETVDDDAQAHISKVVRYVNNEGNIRERFLGFVDHSSQKTATAVYEIIETVVNDLGCNSKLVAQSYDGAIVSAGEFDQLLDRVKEKYPSAVVVHHVSHSLNVVIKQSLNNINECKVFFSHINGLASFFSKSAKRANALNIELRKIWPQLIPIRWNYCGRLVQLIREYRQPLIEFFQKVIANSEDWDYDTVILSEGYLGVIKNEPNFNFLLNVFAEILPSIDSLCGILQNKKIKLDFCAKKINDLQTTVISKGKQFDQLWSKYQELELNTEPQRKKVRMDNIKNEKATFKRLCGEIIDNICSQLEARFKHFTNLKILELTNFNGYNNGAFPGNAFECLKQNYPDHFDFVALHSELAVIYSTSEVLNKNSIVELSKSLIKCELEKSFSETINLCKLSLTIPTTITERSFSALKRIKKFVRSSTQQERLSSLAVLSIEKELVQELRRTQDFYEDVINEFAKRSRRIPLSFK